MLTGIKGILDSVLLLILLTALSAQAATVFSDNFNDNSLDTTKWIEDVVGSSNSIVEQNQQVEFAVYGHGGYKTGHAILRSKEVDIPNWSVVNVSGKWRFLDPYTGEMDCYIYDSDTGEYVGIVYATWMTDHLEEHIRYLSGSRTFYESRAVPRKYANFTLSIHRGYFEYWENGTRVRRVNSTALDDAKAVVLKIGGWDASPNLQYIYFDDISVSVEDEDVTPDRTVYVDQNGWWMDGGEFNPSSTPLQSAINNASEFDTIIVKGGEYSRVSISKSLIIRSENGPDFTTISGTSFEAAVDITSHDVILDGFTITSLGEYEGGVVIEGNNITIENCKVVNCTDFGIAVDNSHNVTIRNCLVSSNSNVGIGLYDSNNIEVENNTISHHTEYGIDTGNLSDSTIFNNTVILNGGGISIFKSSNNTIYFNNFNNSVNADFDVSQPLNRWHSPQQITYIYNGSTYTNHLGNHWRDNYENLDDNGDGVWDYPYIMNSRNSDPFSLVKEKEYYTISGTEDSTPPAITIVSPEMEGVYNSTDVWLNVTANEEIDTWWYSLDGGSNATFIPNTTISVEDGEHSITVYANDSSGNVGYASSFFYIDTTPPQSITNLTYSKGTTWINWTWTNPSGDFSCVLIYFNSIYQTCTIDEFFEVDDLAPSTAYTLSTHTRDQFGNVNQTWVNSTAETFSTTPPILTFTAPKSDVTNRTWVNVSIQSDKDLLNAILEWNGVNESMLGSGKTWYLNETGLNDGVYTYRAFGTDLAENQNSTGVRQITVDTVRPAFLSTGENRTTAKAGNTVKAHAYWQDLHLNKAWIETNQTLDGLNFWHIADTIDLIDPADWSNFTITPSQDDVGKTICWRIYANDTAGNVNVTPVRCFRVIVPLSIIDYNPSQQAFSSADEVMEFNITLNQAADVLWLMNGSILQANTSVTFARYINSSSEPGNWNVTAIATNANGSVSVSWMWTVTTVDSTPPSIDLIYSTLLEKGVRSNISVSISDENPASYVVYKNGSIIYRGEYSSSLEFNISIDTSIPGIFNYTVWANDTAGNSNYSTAFIMVQDTTPPVLIYQPPTPNNAVLSYSTTSVTINATANENLSTCILEWNGVNITFSPIHTRCTIVKPVSQGSSYTFTLYARDVAGNIASAGLRSFSISTPPASGGGGGGIQQKNDKCFAGERPFEIVNPKSSSIGLTTNTVTLKVVLKDYNFANLEYSYSYLDKHIEGWGRLPVDRDEITEVIDFPSTGRVKLTVISVDECDSEYSESVILNILAKCFGEERPFEILSPEERDYLNPNSTIPLKIRLGNYSFKTLGYNYTYYGLSNTGRFGKAKEAFEINRPALTTLDLEKPEGEVFLSKKGRIGLIVEASDTCGNTFTQRLTFTVCQKNTPPEIGILSPINNGIYNDTESLILNADFSDSENNIVFKKYIINGVEENYTGVVPLGKNVRAGWNSVTLVAEDTCGERAEKTIYFFYKGIPAIGDWVIDDEQRCIDKTIVVNGSVIIKNTGKLVMENCRLILNDTGSFSHGVIDNNGSLIVRENRQGRSIISGYGSYPVIISRPSSRLSISGSVLEVGSISLLNNGGIRLTEKTKKVVTNEILKSLKEIPEGLLMEEQKEMLRSGIVSDRDVELFLLAHPDLLESLGIDAADLYSNAAISNSNISHLGSAGILLAGRNILIENNRISGYSGIRLYGAENFSILSNRIATPSYLTFPIPIYIHTKDDFNLWGRTEILPSTGRIKDNTISCSSTCIYHQPFSSPSPPQHLSIEDNVINPAPWGTAIRLDMVNGYPSITNVTISGNRIGGEIVLDVISANVTGNTFTGKNGISFNQGSYGYIGISENNFSTSNYGIKFGHNFTLSGAILRMADNTFSGMQKAFDYDVNFDEELQMFPEIIWENNDFYSTSANITLTYQWGGRVWHITDSEIVDSVMNVLYGRISVEGKLFVKNSVFEMPDNNIAASNIGVSNSNFTVINTTINIPLLPVRNSTLTFKNCGFNGLNSSAVINASSSLIRLENISIGGTGTGIRLYQARGTIENAEISDVDEGIEIISSHVTVKRSDLRGGEIGVRVVRSAIDLSNNSINSTYGVWMENSFTDNIIENNTIGGSHGISLKNSKAIIKRNNVTASSTGIYAENSEVEVVRNGIYNSSKGVHLNSSNGILRDNLLKWNEYGIYQTNGGFPRFHNNTLSSNEYGIYSDSSFLYADFNIISDNHFGIYCLNSPGLIMGNLIHSRGVGYGIYAKSLSGSGNLDIYSNTIYDESYGIYVKDWRSAGGGVSIYFNRIHDCRLGLYMEEGWNVTASVNSIYNNDEYDIYTSVSSSTSIPFVGSTYTGTDSFRSGGDVYLTPALLEWDSPDHGSPLLRASITNITSTQFGKAKEVGDLLSVHVHADSLSGIDTERLYLVNISNPAQIIDLYSNFSAAEKAIDKAIAVSVADVNDGTYDLYYGVTDSAGRKTYSFVRVNVTNTKLEITNVTTTFAKRIYAMLKSVSTGDVDPYPFRERGSFINVTVKNTGVKGGFARLEIVLPEYLHNVTQNPVAIMYLNASEEATYSFYVQLTKHDWINGWEPLPSVFPENKTIPVKVKLYSYPSFNLADSKQSEVHFRLGPIFELRNFTDSGLPYIKIVIDDPYNSSAPYDGDGDGILEAAESHHFNFYFVNVGDEPANITGVLYQELIPCNASLYNPAYSGLHYIAHSSQRYDASHWWQNRSDYVSPSNIDIDNTLLGMLYPAETSVTHSHLIQKELKNGFIDWWPDDKSRGVYPPANYTGEVTTYILLDFSTGDTPYSYIATSINRIPVKVWALQKTFIPASYTLKDGNVKLEVYSVDPEKGTVHLTMHNLNDYVYFEYKADGLYGDHGGYRWYHVLPPEYKFNAFAHNARDPDKTIPHLKVEIGVGWSLWANELKLGMMALEAVVNIILDEVTGGAVNVEFADKVMGITNTLLQVMNAVESINNGVQPIVRIDGIIFDQNKVNELADSGLNQSYFNRVKNGDMDAEMVATFIKAVANDEDLKKIFQREVLKAIAKNLGLEDVYKRMEGPAVTEEDFDKFKEELLDYLVENKKLTKTQAEKIGKVVDAGKVFVDMGEWTYNNMVATGKDEITINVMDPPNSYSVEVEEKGTNYFGGYYAGTENSGEGTVMVEFLNGSLIRISGVYMTDPENFSIPLDRIEEMKVRVTGERDNGVMRGSVYMEIIPEPSEMIYAVSAFRNPELSRLLLSSQFTRLENLTARTLGDRIAVHGSGILRASPRDLKINATAEMNGTAGMVRVEKVGHYAVGRNGSISLNVKFGPVMGVSMNRTELKVLNASHLQSDLPFEKDGNTYYLGHLPVELSLKTGFEGTMHSEKETPDVSNAGGWNSIYIFSAVVAIALFTLAAFMFIKAQNR